MEFKKEFFGLNPKLRRNIGLSQDFIKANASLTTDAPPLDSFFFRVFNENIDIAENVLNTDYLQAMLAETLPPDNYGQLTVLDAYYCYRAAQSFETSICNVDKDKEPLLYALMKDLLSGYLDYNSTFFDYWHIRNASSVNPTEGFESYAEHEHNVACYKNPIYTLVVMIPCYYLWYWFSSKMMETIDPENLYFPWVDGCAGPPDSAYAIGNFIEDWIKSGKEFDEAYAKEIYKQSMSYELRVFSEAYQKQ